MIDLIVNSITVELNKKYNPDFDPTNPDPTKINIRVIHEDLPQNLPDTCFYISALNSSRKNLLSALSEDKFENDEGETEIGIVKDIDRYILNVPLDIHYFPKLDNKYKKSDMNVKSMELLQLLRNITLYELVDNVPVPIEDENGKKSMLHGFNFHTEIVDNVLHFFVEYKPINIIKILKDNDNLMNSLTETVGVLNGE